MACYHPITAYRSRSGRDPKSGKWPLVFNRANGYIDMPVIVPCGQCIGCRLEKSRQWAIRCLHESSLYENNCFLTLTYNDANLPTDGSLNKRDIVLFLKRLRKQFGSGIRFFQCGEYGSLLSRPHHHSIIFNFDFPDKVLWSVREGIRLYRSPILERLWPYGFSTIGDVTFESAAYVARYITKKITGDNSAEYYGGRQPEFITMSRRPGIARNWYEKFYSDVYPADSCVVRPGLICRPPKYYDNLYDLQEPDIFSGIKLKRTKLAKLSQDNDYDRLAVREKVQYLKFHKLIRPLENN
jgi:hypothetical protein